jgi:UDP-N-acetylmuramoyl-L-alanyl-D-glutamate--2,6-diaminopimelate ligase
MMFLKDILNNVSLIEVRGTTEVEATGLVFDSRLVVSGSIYVAIKGTAVDGHDFIEKAISAGASAVVCESFAGNASETTIVITEDSRKSLAIMAANKSGHPSKRLKLVGITGTNGKTTVGTLLFELFGKLGYKCGLLSTVENKIGEKIIPSTHTTPDPVSLNELLEQMVSEGCTHAFMEVSSHAIDQSRIEGLHFRGGVFTNISRDHLDYHSTFKEYIDVKKRFFDGLKEDAFALVNTDDKHGAVMMQNTGATKHRYALKQMANFKGKVLSNTIHGLELDILNQQVWFKLIGEFNAYNLLAVTGTAVLLGEDEQDVLTELSTLGSVNGRFNQYLSSTRVVGIVDYAHTPDALENVLKTISEFKEDKKIITVVGCGGNRDKGKRPMMAKIGAEYSDNLILTSDNPRDENPDTIISDMKDGVPITKKSKVLALSDRAEAIRLACTLAASGDIVLLAGKGHETYQEIAGVKSHFDDKEELIKAFKELNK